MVSLGKTVKSGGKCKGVVICAIIVLIVFIGCPIKGENGELNKMNEKLEYQAGADVMTATPSESASGLSEAVQTEASKDRVDYTLTDLLAGKVNNLDWLREVLYGMGVL